MAVVGTAGYDGATRRTDYADARASRELDGGRRRVACRPPVTSADKESPMRSLFRTMHPLLRKLVENPSGQPALLAAQRYQMDFCTCWEGDGRLWRCHPRPL